MIMYCGAGIFIMHVLRNRLKVTKKTPAFVVIPYLLQLGAKFVGTKWIDFTM